MPTTILNSDFKTGQYKRKLQVFRNRPSTADPDEYIADPGTSTTLAPLTDVEAQVLGSGKGYTASVTPGTYISDNKTSGITFLVFNRVGTVQDVDLNVGADNGSGSTRDFGDSIYIETGDHGPLLAKPPGPLNFINSSITTGTENSPINDNDLVVFGSDQSKDGQTYTFTSSGFTGTINGLLAPGKDQSPLIVQGSTVTTGNGNDTLIFANTIASSQIGGSAAGQGNTFSLGAQNDLVYFASSSQIQAQNVVDLGAGDDTLVLNGTASSGANVLSGLTGTGNSVLNIKGFNQAGDRIFFNGAVYTSSTTDRSSLTANSGNKIIFS